MKSIERGLAEVHRGLLGSNGEEPSVNAAMTSNGHTNGTSRGDSLPRVVENEQAFAVIGFVSNGSPADVAVSMAWV